MAYNYTPNTYNTYDPEVSFEENAANDGIVTKDKMDKLENQVRANSADIVGSVEVVDGDQYSITITMNTVRGERKFLLKVPNLKKYIDDKVAEIESTGPTEVKDCLENVPNKTTNETIPAALDRTTGKLYVPDMTGATAEQAELLDSLRVTVEALPTSILDTSNIPTKTLEQTIEVSIDYRTGKLYVPDMSGATTEQLMNMDRIQGDVESLAGEVSGIKENMGNLPENALDISNMKEKTDNETVEVSIDKETGKLYVPAGGDTKATYNKVIMTNNRALNVIDGAYIKENAPQKFRFLGYNNIYEYTVTRGESDALQPTKNTILSESVYDPLRDKDGLKLIIANSKQAILFNNENPITNSDSILDLKYGNRVIGNTKSLGVNNYGGFVVLSVLITTKSDTEVDCELEVNPDIVENFVATDNEMIQQLLPNRNDPVINVPISNHGKWIYFFSMQYPGSYDWIVRCTNGVEIEVESVYVSRTELDDKYMKYLLETMYGDSSVQPSEEEMIELFKMMAVTQKTLTVHLPEPLYGIRTYCTSEIQNIPAVIPGNNTLISRYNFNLNDDTKIDSSYNRIENIISDEVIYEGGNTVKVLKRFKRVFIDDSILEWKLGSPETENTYHVYYANIYGDYESPAYYELDSRFTFYHNMPYRVDNIDVMVLPNLDIKEESDSMSMSFCIISEQTALTEAQFVEILNGIKALDKNEMPYLVYLDNIDGTEQVYDVEISSKYKGFSISGYENEKKYTSMAITFSGDLSLDFNIASNMNNSIVEVSYNVDESYLELQRMKNMPTGGNSGGGSSTPPSTPVESTPPSTPVEPTPSIPEPETCEFMQLLVAKPNDGGTEWVAYIDGDAKVF